MSRAVMQQTLEAYLCREMPAGTVIGDPKWWAPKIAAVLESALAQPEQEPVAWMFTDAEGTEFFEQRGDWAGKWEPIYTAPPQPVPDHPKQMARLGWQYVECPACGSEGARAFPKPEEQPVAYWIPKAEQFCFASPTGRPFAKAWEPLYTSPPQRQPLTDEQWFEFWDGCSAIPHDSSFPEFLRIARAIEAAHDIKEAA